ncbi:unnamed protein product [Acanthoscelides obtectus]|uniref:PH domain-containing protein n=1 Tax=Acanthoscelides obtectus TaxID=200917 RepID=A0A9P0JUV5_ACAOB|nr:unnamed protein product [Acanthoscelides obtectus]CAK1625386.1 Spectrin beta chain [Acanthoscelides obtectus]
MSDELGRDAGSVNALQRKHQNFVQDLQTLHSHVQQIQDESAKLQASYAGDRAKEITNREQEVVAAWNALQLVCEQRQAKLADTGDLFKFFNLVRTLMQWMDEWIRQMNTSEKPRDVSGVELLMNNHQSLKAEVEAREDNFTSCISLGKELLNRNHYASSEIKEKLVMLTNHRNGVLQRWEERWENLQLILEVYQFARDAAVAEAWLIAQEPYLMSQELGRTIDEVENLIKKHEAFEKSAAAQEERFSALERLTTFELRQMKRRQEAAEAAEKARKEKEEAERRAQMEAAKPKEAERVSTDHPDTGAQSGEERVEARSELKSRKKERSRSKSPFRSFRWKKEKKISTGAHSDDEGASSAYQESGPSDSGASGDVLEGHLVRKHEWENTTTKATNRSWDKVYCLVKGTQMSFYRDAKNAKSTPDQRFKGEPPLSLRGAQASQAQDYKKKKHVFRLRLESGGEFLFQAHDDNEMNTWISHINTQAELDASGPSRSQTLPASAQKEDSKRRSFFTLKKT